MNHKEHLRRFLFPSLTPRFLLRVLIVALMAYLIFGRIFVPVHIEGASMEPTCRDGGFRFYWRQAYLFSKPKRYDIVTVRFAGQHVMLLKRVIAVEGEKVEFHEGKLFVDGKLIEEPYIRKGGRQISGELENRVFFWL